jgi:hypothetical protein
MRIRNRDSSRVFLLGFWPRRGRAISRYRRSMPRRRNPDALSDADRQRRYMRSHDLGVLKLPKTALCRLDAIARERTISRRAAFVIVLNEWEAGRSGISAERLAAATRGKPPSRRAEIKGGSAAKPVRDEGQHDLFGAITSAGTRDG